MKLRKGADNERGRKVISKMVGRLKKRRSPEANKMGEQKAHQKNGSTQIIFIAGEQEKIKLYKSPSIKLKRNQRLPMSIGARIKSNCPRETICSRYLSWFAGDDGNSNVAMTSHDDEDGGPDCHGELRCRVQRAIGWRESGCG